MPTRVVWGHECYTVPWHDGTLLVGSTVEDAGFDENAKSCELRPPDDLLERLARHPPRGESVELARGIRMGLRCLGEEHGLVFCEHGARGAEARDELRVGQGGHPRIVTASDRSVHVARECPGVQGMTASTCTWWPAS